MNKPTVTIDYTQLNRAERPQRYAQISSRIYGLPFEGLDSFSEGKGAMEGYLAKFFRIFNQTGDYMDKACLFYLAETFFLPSIALREDITYEELDALTVKATMRAYGIQVSGIFTFNEKGEMAKFTWTAECAGYTTIDGMRVPSRLKATWSTSKERMSRLRIITQR